MALNEEERIIAMDSPSDSESSQSEVDAHKVRDLARQNTVVAEMDSEEEELERLVLGDKASFREQLFKQNAMADAEDALQDLDLEDAAPDQAATGLEDVDDSAFFFYDSGAQPAKEQSLVKTIASSGDGKSDPSAPAWEDSDDERLSVSLASVGRLRKLRVTEAEDVVSGKEYTRRLRQQYLRLHPMPSWVADAEKRSQKQRRRRSSDSSGSDSSVASDGEENEDLGSALPLEKFLRSVSAFSDAGSRKKRKLRPEVIDIQRTRDIPDTHRGPVESLSFHPRHPVLLSSSTSSILFLHHISPSAHPTPNPLLTSVQAKQLPLRRSEFLRPDGDQVFFAGRRRFFHSWDLSTGQVKKVSKVQGHRLEQKSMERFRLSPCGRYMAVIATDRKGGGMLNILGVNTMQWVAQARLDSRGGIADFAWWSTGDGISILGRDGQVGEWSMETKRFLGLWRDEGSIGGTVIALGGHNGPAELGGQRWAAVGSKSGILNVYDRQNLLVTKKTGEVEIKAQPEPNRAFDQLVTPITAVTFTPDGQILAFASQHKKDAFKLVHLPSCTVYRNWPTDQTPLGRITAVAFGSESNMLAVGNELGKIRLWEIRS